MSRSQILPDACYDWYVRDSRDGERWGPYDNVSDARNQLRFLRAYIEPYKRCVYSVRRCVSEDKVLTALRAAARGSR